MKEIGAQSVVVVRELNNYTLFLLIWINKILDRQVRCDNGYKTDRRTAAIPNEPTRTIRLVSNLISNQYFSNHRFL